MEWIFVHIEESGGSVAALDLSSVSMIAKSDDGTSTIFFSNPNDRIRVVDRFEDLIAQLKLIDIDIMQKLKISEGSVGKSGS